jgi:polyisoprenoid-binding protein YceI
MMTTRRTTPLPLVGLVLAVAALAAAASAAGLATTYRPMPSKVTVSGTSTLHDWTVESAKIEGEVTVPEGFLAGDAAVQPTVAVSIPAGSLASGKKKMDDLMHGALRAEEHKSIQYRLVSAKPKSGAGSDRVVLDTRGRLTIAGKTREVPMEVEVLRQAGGRLLVKGTAAITMSDFGMKPPTAMLGTVKTGDDVTVRFEWTLGPAAAAAGAGR